VLPGRVVAKQKPFLIFFGGPTIPEYSNNNSHNEDFSGRHRSHALYQGTTLVGP
jgi:hypothetical protein